MILQQVDGFTSADELVETPRVHSRTHLLEGLTALIRIHGAFPVVDALASGCHHAAVTAEESGRPHLSWAAAAADLSAAAERIDWVERNGSAQLIASLAAVAESAGSGDGS